MEALSDLRSKQKKECQQREEKACSHGVSCLSRIRRSPGDTILLRAILAHSEIFC